GRAAFDRRILGTPHVPLKVKQPSVISPQLSAIDSFFDSHGRLNGDRSETRRFLSPCSLSRTLLAVAIDPCTFFLVNRRRELVRGHLHFEAHVARLDTASPHAKQRIRLGCQLWQRREDHLLSLNPIRCWSCGFACLEPVRN